MASPSVPPIGDFRRVLEQAIGRLEQARSSGRLRMDGLEVRVFNNVWVIEEGVEIDSLSVVGDVHGDYRTFNYVLSRTFRSLRVFVGDYVDRGPPEGQVYTLYEILRLFTEGDTLIPLRGNHEPPDYLTPYPHDFPDALEAVYPGEGRSLYRLAMQLFDSLPHALLIEGRTLILHGGIPVGPETGFNRLIQNPTPTLEDRIEYLGGQTYPPPRETLQEILWNDPDPDLQATHRPNTERGVGYKWGQTATIQVLPKLKVHLIIRGHEWARQGYKIDHQGKILTLFSRIGEPYPNEKAAIFHCPNPTRERIIEIVKGGGQGLSRCIQPIKPPATIY